MKFQNIPKIKNSHYRISLPWKHLNEQLQDYYDNYKLDLNPDFQRDHVWTERQQIAYIEYILRNGMSGRELYFNCPGWMRFKDEGDMQLVDGKQRITAVLKFLNNEIKAFGHYYSEFEDELSFDYSFSLNVNNLQNYKDVLQWYIDLNSGIAHTEKEINKVKNLINKEN